MERKFSINKASSMTLKLILKKFVQEKKYALKKNILFFNVNEITLM